MLVINSSSLHQLFNFSFSAAMQNVWGKSLRLCSVTFDREERPSSTNPGKSNMESDSHCNTWKICIGHVEIKVK